MTIRQKQCLLAYLGYYTGDIDGLWGDRSRQATEKFQRDFGITADGDPGPETQKALTHAVAYGMPTREEAEIPSVSEEETVDATGTFWDEIEYFDPPEAACKCGKYCDGYPHEMQPLTMQIADRARKHFGKPITIVSGLRCSRHNAAVGGVVNSQHMFGEALDVFFHGVAPSVALAWLQSQPDVRYAYQIAGSNNIHFDIQPVGR